MGSDGSSADRKGKRGRDKAPRAEPKERPAHWYKPGQSGNPGGRHKGIAEVAAAARECTEVAITALREVAQSGPPAARVAAASALLDRGYGRPQQAVHVSQDGGDPLGIAEARAAARELFKDPEARAALRLALWGAAAPVVRDVAVIEAGSAAVAQPAPATLNAAEPASAGSSPAPSSDWFEAVLASHKRIAIAGGPRTGKTTLSQRVTDRPVFHGDDHIALGWSESSLAMARDVESRPGPLVVEGVQVPRALRKGMTVDVVIWLERPYTPQTPDQAIMAKGCRTVFDEWRASNPTVPVVYAP